jgi:hypothetical protein
MKTTSITVHVPRLFSVGLMGSNTVYTCGRLDTNVEGQQNASIFSHECSTYRFGLYGHVNEQDISRILSNYLKLLPKKASLFTAKSFR